MHQYPINREFANASINKLREMGLEDIAEMLSDILSEQPERIMEVIYQARDIIETEKAKR